MKKTKSIYLALLAVLLSPMVANADPINAPVPTSEYITVGLADWAWASACSPTNLGCGLDLTYQMTQGWRLPTVLEITNAVGAAGGPLAWAGLFGPNGAFRCATQYFSNVYCQYSNAVAGYIYNTSDGQAPNSGEETFVIRVSAVAVPEPGTLALLGLGLVGMAARRRKNV